MRKLFFLGVTLLVASSLFWGEAIYAGPEVPKGSTGAFPDTPRAEWYVDMLKDPTYRPDGLLAFEYAVYADAATFAAKGQPFLYNSHLAMVRETHQRILKTPTGDLRHVSGAEVAPEDVTEFLANDPGAYKWEYVDVYGDWVDGKGRKLSPFVFPTYWGDPEDLDPQWLRESYLLPQEGQVDTLIERYLRGAEARKLSGDHRGTTLDVQVGASTDDMWVSVANSSTAPHTWTGINLTSFIQLFGELGASRFGQASRFDNVTVPGTDDIDVAHLIFNPEATRSSAVVRSDIYGEDADDASTFSTVGNYNGRSKTAVVTQDGVGTWTQDVPVNTVSIITPVTTIKNRGGWASGQAMAFAVEDGDSDDEVFRSNDTYNSDTSLAAILHIEHSAAGAERRIMIIMSIMPVWVFGLFGAWMRVVKKGEDQQRPLSDDTKAKQPSNPPAAT